MLVEICVCVAGVGLELSAVLGRKADIYFKINPQPAKINFTKYEEKVIENKESKN